MADNAYSSHSLIVSWQKAVGVAERYDILLLNENGILLSNTSEPATAKQHKFEDLTPGKKYKMQILTISGGLFSKEAQTEGRTGNYHKLMFCIRYLLVCYYMITIK
jgi:cadherin 5 type 2 (VE-cadherin)